MNIEPLSPDALKEDAVLPMKIEARARPVEGKENFVGYASAVLNDSFVVDGIRLYQNDEGKRTMQMPGRQDAKGEWRQVCKPITSEMHSQMKSAVFEAYDKAVEKSRGIVAAADKPSLQGALKDNAEKAQAQPPREAPAKAEPAL